MITAPLPWASPSGSGRLSMIIPQYYGLTITYVYHTYYGCSHVIKVIISQLNFLRIRYHPCVTFDFISWKPTHAVYCNYGIKWQYLDYRMITVPSPSCFALVIVTVNTENPLKLWYNYYIYILRFSIEQN